MGRLHGPCVHLSSQSHASVQQMTHPEGDRIQIG